MRAVRLTGIGVLALLAASFRANAEPTSPVMGNTCAAHVPEAANRSGLSADILLRVMRAESGGNARIVSAKGAMGCMQIMPATWTYLTSRYILGADPFDARGNIIGGALYLAELTARYGLPGALAAYNAGRGRYERFAAGTASLPAETIAYTARIGTSADATHTIPPPARWQEASLFLDHDARRAPAALAPTQRDHGASAGRDALFPLAPLDRSRLRTAGP